MPSSPKRLTVQIAVRVDQALLDLIDRDAGAHERTRAQTVRHICREAMAREGLLPGG